MKNQVQEQISAISRKIEQLFNSAGHNGWTLMCRPRIRRWDSPHWGASIIARGSGGKRGRGSSRPCLAIWLQICVGWIEHVELSEGLPAAMQWPGQDTFPLSNQIFFKLQIPQGRFNGSQCRLMPEPMLRVVTENGTISALELRSCTD